MTWGSSWRGPATLGLVVSLMLALGGVAPSIAGTHEAAVSKLRPRGALYGRVRYADGRAASDASVGVYDESDLDPLSETIFVLASLGLVCFIPGFCGSHGDATVDPSGAWYVTHGDLPHPSEKAFRVIGDLPRGGGQLVAPETTLFFANKPDPQRSKDVVFWQPRLQVRHGRTGFDVTWSPLTKLPRGKQIAYAPYRLGTDAFAEATLVGKATNRHHVHIPDWQVEDQPFQVYVDAATRTGQVAYSYGTGSTDATRGPRPISRGDRCLADGKHGGPLHPTAGSVCAFTDGDLESNEEILLPGQPDNGRVDHRRVCVDLRKARKVGLVVVRTPFVSSDMFVETSDGHRFHTVGALSNVDFTELDSDHGDAFPVFLDKPARTRFVCVRDTEYGEGFEGSILDEISVWGPQQG